MSSPKGCTLCLGHWAIQRGEERGHWHPTSQKDSICFHFPDIFCQVIIYESLWVLGKLFVKQVLGKIPDRMLAVRGSQPLSGTVLDPQLLKSAKLEWHDEHNRYTQSNTSRAIPIYTSALAWDLQAFPILLSYNACSVHNNSISLQFSFYILAWRMKDLWHMLYDLLLWSPVRLGQLTVIPSVLQPFPTNK